MKPQGSAEFVDPIDTPIRAHPSDGMTHAKLDTVRGGTIREVSQHRLRIQAAVNVTIRAPAGGTAT
ncbi:MAG: hypothetical protein AAFY46_16855, partial [Planctomycetota bacterium]